MAFSGARRVLTVLAALCVVLALAPVPGSGAARAGPSSERFLSRSGYTVYYVQATRATRFLPVRAGVGFVDRFTGRSQMRLGTCPSPRPRHVGCITMTVRPMPGPVVGRAAWYSDGRARIRFDTGLRGRSERLQRLTVLHELGHAFGLDHSRTCRSIMYANPACGRHKYFTANEVRHLARQ